MNTETHREPHGSLDWLYYRVKDFEPDFPSPNDHQMLGIRALQVPTTNDEVIQLTRASSFRAQRVFSRNIHSTIPVMSLLATRAH
jgi:hypothetical protein